MGCKYQSPLLVVFVSATGDARPARPGQARSDDGWQETIQFQTVTNHHHRQHHHRRQRKVTGQSTSSNSLVAPRTPLRQHSPQIIQQSKQNLHLICHSAAVPKAALRGPSTMSTESPVSQPQTLFLFRSVTFTFTSTPIAQTTTTTPKNRLHCTKQDRNS